MRWLILMCLAATEARADDPLYACKAVASNTNVDVQFSADPPVRDVVTWLMGTSCNNFILDPAVANTTVKLASGTYKQSQTVPRALAALAAAGLRAEQRGSTIVVARKGKRACPSVAASTPAATSGATPAATAGACKPPTGKLLLTFQPEHSVADLGTWLTSTMCKQVVFATDVPKTALRSTILAPNRYSPDEATRLVIAAIETTGLVVRQAGNRIDIRLGPDLPTNCSDATTTK